MTVRVTFRRWWGVVFLAGLAGLVGCEPSTGPQLQAISAPELTQTADVIIAALPTMTRTPVPTLAPSATPTATPTPTATATATSTRTPFRTNTPRPSPTQPIAVTPTGAAVAAGNGGQLPGEPSWTPPPLDQALTINDHHWFARPIPYGNATWADRSYPYASTGGRGLQVHHGVEFVNDYGTPVIAVKDGTVFYAGNDSSIIFGPSANFYGNLVIIQHDNVTPDTGEPIFSLYGHLSAVEVTAGQRVIQGDQIGQVGASGVAQGPHLHFEVRVGDPNDYGSTRNPEMWIYPYRGYGTLAGRITDANGNVLYEVPLSVVSATDPSFSRTAFSYAPGTVNGDTTYHENFTLGDLPSDYYNLAIRSGGSTLYRDQIFLYPNRTTWLEIQLP